MYGFLNYYYCLKIPKPNHRIVTKKKSEIGNMVTWYCNRKRDLEGTRQERLETQRVYESKTVLDHYTHHKSETVYKVLYLSGSHNQKTTFLAALKTLKSSIAIVMSLQLVSSTGHTPTSTQMAASFIQLFGTRVPKPVS